MMKYIWMCLFFVQWANMAMAEDLKPARLYGKIKDYTGENMVIYYGHIKKDTVPVDKDGRFDYTTQLEEAMPVNVSFDEHKCGLQLFMENGMVAKLDISFVQEKDESAGMVFYEAQVDYEGDNKDCMEFLKAYQDWALLKNPWPFTRLDTLSFAEYREKYLEDVDSVKSELMKVKSAAFRRGLAEEIDYSIPMNLFRFAWSKPRQDVDFNRWIESFDRNDPENIGLTEMYVRYYYRSHPAPQEQKGVHYLRCLQQVLTNQEIINEFADDYVENYLKQAPENMAEVLELYKKVSTNTEAHAQADAVYAHYKSLQEGMPALDFDMVDEQGKAFRLSDFRGKAVYIDVWATWCGPCCAEIPHMEKLAAHYAKNKKIVLISISLDSSKSKWMKKLAQDKPAWKQFICPDAFGSQLCKNYDINAIPRFLFFDKKGNIISLNAPRPSSEEIIEYIDKHL